jgi:hypothetical protein
MSVTGMAAFGCVLETFPGFRQSVCARSAKRRLAAATDLYLWPGGLAEVRAEHYSSFNLGERWPKSRTRKADSDE